MVREAQTRDQDQGQQEQVKVGGKGASFPGLNGQGLNAALLPNCLTLSKLFNNSDSTYI